MSTNHSFGSASGLAAVNTAECKSTECLTFVRFTIHSDSVYCRYSSATTIIKYNSWRIRIPLSNMSMNKSIQFRFQA